MTDVAKPGIFSRSAVWALLCAALILLAGFAQVHDVHPDRSGTSHECSLCPVPHAGAIAAAAFQLRPFSAPALRVHGVEASPLPLLGAALLSTRAPPSIE